jgi:hypothetical protein
VLAQDGPEASVSGHHVRTAVAFLPEGGGAPGGVVTGQVLGFSRTTLAWGASSAAMLAPAMPAPMTAMS